MGLWPKLNNSQPLPVHVPNNIMAGVPSSEHVRMRTRTMTTTTSAAAAAAAQSIPIPCYTDSGLVFCVEWSGILISKIASCRTFPIPLFTPSRRTHMTGTGRGSIVVGASQFLPPVSPSMAKHNVDPVKLQWFISLFLYQYYIVSLKPFQLFPNMK